MYRQGRKVKMASLLMLSEEFLFTCEEKLKYFGYGEWVEELDKLVFECQGFTCIVSRHSDIRMSGHLHGYVHVPLDHPIHRTKNFHTIACHGKLSYIDMNYVGFECNQPTDYVPLPNGTTPKFSSYKNDYKNVDFCIEICKIIVDQLLMDQIIEDRQKEVAHENQGSNEI
jgi:hypothetical protein